MYSGITPADWLGNKCAVPFETVFQSVTIPAALSALNSYLSAIYRVGYGFSLEDYWKEFKSDILEKIFWRECSPALWDSIPVICSVLLEISARNYP